MEPVTVKNSIEIILTPQFYTFIRETLDLKFSYQAKQIAESLFDDYINSSEKYQYHVYKCEDQWCYFAYNIEEIEIFLKSVGIEKHRVSKIYFAQQLSSELEQAIQLSKSSVLQTIDGTVTMLPSKFMNSDTQFNTLNLNSIKLSSGISMGASLNSFISLKETIVLTSLFSLLGVIFILEGSRLKSSISEDDEKLTALLDENTLYGSSIQRSSILGKYQPINDNERAKRQTLKEISKLLSSGSQLESLTINQNTIIANIKTSDRATSSQVTNRAKAKQFKSSANGEMVKVEKKI